LAGVHVIARKAADRTYTIFKLLQERSIPGLDRTVYNIVLTAFARSRQPNRAESLLDEMIVTSTASCRRGSDPVTSPDVVSYSTIIMGYYLLHRMDSGERGDAKLQTMKQNGVIPNERVYNNCIKCWAATTSDKFAPNELKQRAVHRSEALLQEMKFLYGLQPSSHIYSSLLSVYLHCQEFPRVEGLVHTWLVDYETTKSPRLRPDVFLILQRIWAESSRTESLFDVASTAHHILCHLGEHDIPQNRDWYKKVLQAYTQIRHDKVTDRALELLHEMKSVAGVEPDVDCYKNVIQVIVRNNDDGSSDKVEELLQEMKSMGLATEESLREYNRSNATRE
jgi:pentatricopeptide repeat protein